MPVIRIAEFDTWRAGYGLAVVRIVLAGTNTDADVFTDEGLTQAAFAQQTLQERMIDGASYGKFTQTLYTSLPYQLEINNVDQTGIVRPALTTLDQEDASAATVRVAGGSKDVALESHLARRIDVRDEGDFIAVGGLGASASTNNATLVDAIGKAGALGGGYVELPAGTYQFTSLTLPTGVVLRGIDRKATILRSTESGKVITVGGERAGLCRLTVDGVSKVASSIGLYAHDKDEIVLDDAQIKRFATGLKRDGGKECDWRELYISDCTDGYQLHGDDDEEPPSEAKFNRWRGGRVDFCTGAAIELRQAGRACTHNLFERLGLESNTGTALKIVGARATSFRDGWWRDNTVNIDVEDGDPETKDNTVVGLEIADCSIKDGEINLRGNLEAVAFRRCSLEDIEITLTGPRHPVLAQDCREIADVTISGDATAWHRTKSHEEGSASGITTGNATTKAWAISLEPGQRVYLEAIVVARSRNTADDAFYHFTASARRPGATLAYDTQTANFTVGNILTGGTSEATARIVADSDSGATGTLTLQDVVGNFQDNEIITDGATGSATANGSIATSNAELVGSVYVVRSDESNSNFAASFAANGPEIELQVVGIADRTIEWTAHVKSISS